MRIQTTMIASVILLWQIFSAEGTQQPPAVQTAAEGCLETVEQRKAGESGLGVVAALDAKFVVIGTSAMEKLQVQAKEVYMTEADITKSYCPTANEAAIACAKWKFKNNNLGSALGSVKTIPQLRNVWKAAKCQ